MTFEEMRREAARRALEEAAACPDSNEAFWMQTVAEDLARDLTDEECELYREAGIDV